MEMFVKFCDEMFTSFTVPVEESISSDQETNDKAFELTEKDSVPSPMQVDTPTPVLFTPSPLRSRIELTPRKLKLKQRLNFLSSVRSSEKQKYRKRIKLLNEKLDTQRFNQIKYLKQDTKRKQESIKKKVGTITSLRNEIRQLKKEPNRGDDTEKLKRKHQAHIRRLKESHKRRTKANTETVSTEKYLKLKNELHIKDQLILQYEYELFELKEKITELEKEKTPERETKNDGRTYSIATRMVVYDSIVNNVPTKNIPILMESHAKRSGEILTSTPHRTTVEQMARELDSIADLKSAELAMNTKHLTLGFDATTQAGVHINSIHLTSETDCDVVAVDELAGGTAEDYHRHITKSVDYLAEVYSDYHAVEYQYCRSVIIDNISNTMNDRVNVNHATIKKVNESWGKTLNELNCHLHPLETIASTCRSTLKSVETVKGDLHGKDCVAANIVLQINKLRYKDGKGDPKGFKVFLDDNNLPRGIIPRYRGNRLHSLFHICGILFEHHELFLDFLTNGAVPCGGLVSCIRKDFSSKPAIIEMQVLGLIGKLLTGPWMQLFYTQAQSEINHVQGISVVKQVVSTLRHAVCSPSGIIQQNTDFFGRNLDENDKTLHALKAEPKDEKLFLEMISACLLAIIAVIERQYKRYFEMELTEDLQRLFQQEPTTLMLRR